MRAFLFAGVLSAIACFNPQIPGGQVGCPDNVCPDGLTCNENTLVCVADTGDPCVFFAGCEEFSFCIEGNGSDLPVAFDELGECTAAKLLDTGDACTIGNFLDLCPFGAICASGDGTVVEGEPGFCQFPTQLFAGDACQPGNALQSCAAGTSCDPVTNLCGSVAGQAGDTCGNALPIDGPTTLFVDYGGFGADTIPDVDVECPAGQSGNGPDVFFTYTVAGNNVTLVVKALSNASLGDTTLYASLDGCNAADNTIINQIACQEDLGFEPAGGSLDASNKPTIQSLIRVPNLSQGQQVTVVLDAFAVGLQDTNASLSFIEE
jgi:hypothetical protein